MMHVCSRKVHHNAPLFGRHFSLTGPSIRGLEQHVAPRASLISPRRLSPLVARFQSAVQLVAVVRLTKSEYKINLNDKFIDFIIQNYNGFGSICIVMSERSERSSY